MHYIKCINLPNASYSDIILLINTYLRINNSIIDLRNVHDQRSNQ